MPKTKQIKAAPEQDKSSAAPQPLLFRNPVPLLKDRHIAAGLSENADFNFAKPTNSVPINAPEFAESCKYYPIAFTSDDSATPVAIMGVEDKKNQFVSKMGDWRSNYYIPAYIRRYPFALMAGEGDNLILCVDEASERYTAKAKKGDHKFFDKEEQSALTNNAINFCAQYHHDFVATQAFSKELKSSGLLVSKQVNINVKNGKPIALGGLSIVDEKKLRDLDEKTLKRWHQNGYLALIYFHILSGSNWNKLASFYTKAK